MAITPWDSRLANLRIRRVSTTRMQLPVVGGKVAGGADSGSRVSDVRWREILCPWRRVEGGGAAEASARRDVRPAVLPAGRNIDGRSDTKIPDCCFSLGSGPSRGDDPNGAPPGHLRAGCAAAAMRGELERKRTRDSVTIIPF